MGTSFALRLRTQPPLSRATAQLESRLGVALFEPTTRSAQVTAAGDGQVVPLVARRQMDDVATPVHT